MRKRVSSSGLKGNVSRDRNGDVWLGEIPLISRGCLLILIFFDAGGFGLVIFDPDLAESPKSALSFSRVKKGSIFFINCSIVPFCSACSMK